MIGSLAAGRLVAPDIAPRAILVGTGAMAVSLGLIPVLPTFPLIFGAGAVGGTGSGMTFVPWLAHGAGGSRSRAPYGSSAPMIHARGCPRPTFPACCEGVFVAAGGNHDDWDDYDRAMAEDRRAALFITPDRIWPNG